MSLRTKLKKIKEIYEKLDVAIYPLLGLPSYSKYLEHFKKTHPNEKPLDKKEFFKQAQDSKAKNIRC